ncbi:TPA: helix-turn-helix domain-containing protein, partial [Streptococcus pneumoniae]
YVINVCDVGKRIKELRISSNLTQDKIAEYLSLYLSLNQSMIAKMEKGERNITNGFK